MRNIIESTKIALQALWSHKLRAILTTLGIVIGVLTVVGIISIIEGLNKGFANQISSLGSDVLYIDRYPWVNTSADAWWQMRGRPRITLEHYEYVKEHSRLAQRVIPQVSSRAEVSKREHAIENASIVGTNEYGLEGGFGPQDIAEGRFLSFIDVDRNRMVAVIGHSIVQTLFPNTNPIGQRINLANRRFLVIGVLKSQGNMLGNDMDSNIYIPHGAFTKTFGSWRSYMIAVKVGDPGKLEDARIELTGLMRTARSLKPREAENFEINNQEMLMNFYRQVTSGLWATAIGIGGISLLVGGIGIMNIMLVSVTERTREIGIRKALGATRGNVLMQFLIESMMVCMVGVIIGMGAAAGLAYFIDKSTPLPASISMTWAVLGIGFVVVIGVLFGLWPASRAAKLNPIDALRYE
ncbi:MAG: ABC transporter permease [Candidatus Marinimicrobia bacterium]|nr:ABC transporter permease [Candidatus Neomarinimicrobiota bacterium]MCF7829518.1 ABC transporter permease [Candidatus Neomarinimicrobiota bacterium]MCF7880084.1 ABC transporter permease [Candidatus Neomarinimicrobiota bacterium]